MAEDLMNTQTGGTGETIQLQPEVQTTPEQFDVKINPPVDSEPVSTETPSEVNTVQSQEQPIETTPPVVEEQQTIVEGEPVEPPVTREGMVEVSLSDDADTRSVIQDLGIPTEAPAMPSQVEAPAELDLSGYTIDGAEQATNIIPVEEEEIQTGPNFESIDLSKYTIDGVEQAVDQEAKKQEKIIEKEYKGTPVSINEKGEVKVQTKPKQPTKEMDGELYTYKGRPGVMYKRKGPNDWYIDTKGDGNFIKITKNAKSRVAELERSAVKVGTEKPKTFIDANKTISQNHGNVTKDFTEFNMLTAGGDPIITKGLNFSELTKSNTPGKTDMYTNSGQINFNYDPEYAKANKETRALLDAQSEKPDGLYRFPGSDALYEKKGKSWLKDSSGTGKNFKQLSKGDVAKREAALEAKAVPTNEYTVAFNVAANIAKTKKFKPEIKPADFSLTDEIQEKYSFDEAKNFADKDLTQMFAKNQTFSSKQLTDMLEIQKQAKQIIGDGKYDPIKGKAIDGLMSDLNEYFDNAKSFNEKINSAYASDQSLSRFLLEEKRKEYVDLLDVDGSTNAFQDAAKETFESTLKMVDFIQDAVDDGKMLYDREKGGFKFSTNTTKTERAYYEKQLGKYLAEYNKVLGTRFESINEDITDLKGTMRENLVKISSIKGRMSKLNSDSPEYKELSKDLWELTSENKKIKRDVENKQSLKSTVFHTEPKKLVASLKPTGSAQVIFSAIPENISPKQKFDLFYKQLLDKNNRLEKENNINGRTLAGKLSQYGREMLDWEGYFSLSDAEKEWLDNRSMLNQLSPLYFNNDFGFTESSGGFYNTIVNGLGALFAPKASRAAGYFNQSEVANTTMNTLNEKGFKKDDIVDANYLKALKEKTNVEFWSRENFGTMLGTTLGIIVPLIITKKIPSTSLRVASRLENLVTKTKNAENLALFMTRAENVFDSTLKATKYGKYLVNPIKTGLEFEATGRVFKSTQDEMYFLSGLAGGIASEGFAAIASKLPTNKVYGYMKSMFGGQTDRAVNVIKRIGELNARGLGETAEEFGNELANIYNDELRTKGFFDEVKSQFGDLDRVQEFVISTFIMGAAFEIVDSDKKRAAYDSLSPEKKAQVDEVLNSVREDMQSAEDKVDEYVDEQTEEVDRKQKFEKEPQKEAKTNDLGEIEFDAESIKEASEGRPSVVAESKEEPASFTEPIDLTKLEEDAEKDQAGIPSEERKGEEPIETKPVVETGKEEVSPSGVVQEEQGQVKPTPDVLDVLGKKVNMYSNFIPNEQNVEPEAIYTFRGDSKEEIPELLRDKATVNVFEDLVNKTKKEKWNASINGSDLAKIYEERQVEGEGIVRKERRGGKIKTAKFKGEEVAITETIIPKTSTAEAESMINEANQIKKTRNKQDKENAEIAFQEKHGFSYKKVSKIDTNFANIVKRLENNKLIEKEC